MNATCPLCKYNILKGNEQVWKKLKEASLNCWILAVNAFCLMYRRNQTMSWRAATLLNILSFVFHWTGLFGVHLVPLWPPVWVLPCTIHEKMEVSFRLQTTLVLLAGRNWNFLRLLYICNLLMHLFTYKSFFDYLIVLFLTEMSLHRYCLWELLFIVFFFPAVSGGNSCLEE